MAKKNENPNVLRELAEACIHSLPDEIGISEDEKQDLITSLVRQWISYAGHAILFLGDLQFGLDLKKTPLGGICLNPEPREPEWLALYAHDWKIKSEDVPMIFAQLNRGQSAEAINAEGLPLRLWINPLERTQGIESLVQTPISPKEKPYRKIASGLLEKHFGPRLPADEKESLADSMVEQWQMFQGHACIFNGGSKVVCILTEQPDGCCGTTVEKQKSDIEAVLCSIGFPSEDIPEVLAKINLNKPLEFHDKRGVRCRLWHNPQTREIYCAPLDPVPQQSVPPAAAPIFCPQCQAILQPWQEGQRQQHCPLCRRTISLS
jgi:hypothetical protein